MTAHAAEDIAKHVKVYVSVFIALMVLTIATVTVASMKHSMATAILLAMLIASIKGSLVACYFMHLISEKKIIYWVLGVAAFFFILLMSLPVMDIEFGFHVANV